MDHSPTVFQALSHALAPLAPARLLVGFSGGLDSTALLALTHRYAIASEIDLVALHVNHGVHPDAAHWERHCGSVCAQLDVAFEVGRLQAMAVPPAGTSEGALRAARYAYFASRMRRGDVLLTGHHRDDVAETLLLNLMRGAGVQGIAAVPARRPLGAGLVVRPLLGAARADLLPMARQAGLTWIEDSSNQELAPRRNFIRHRVLPLLGERWPGAAANLARAAELTREAADLLAESLCRDLEQIRSGDPAILALDRLQQLDPARQRGILRLWLRDLGIGPPTRARLQELVRQLACARPDAQPLGVFAGCQIRRYRQGLYALHPMPPINPATRLAWHSGRVELPGRAGTLEWRRRDDGQALRTDVPHLDVRFATAEKHLKPAGQRHRRPLRLLFQEAGLPPWERPGCPLIFVGERLIGVGDLYWTDEFEKIQQALGARYRWRRPPRLDPAAPLG